MRNVHKMYLGWGAVREAYMFPANSIVVMAHKRDSHVLRGEEADEFARKVRETNHHICGIEHHEWVAVRMCDFSHDPNRDKLFASVFDEYMKYA